MKIKFAILFLLLVGMSTKAYPQGGVCAVDGVKYASVGAALAAGCLVIDARGGLGSLALGTLDPGGSSPPVTILLGPYAYTAVQITVRSGFQLIGTGASEISFPPYLAGDSTTAGTTITSVSSTNQPVFVLPQANHAFVQDLLLSRFNLNPASGATTQDGMLFDSSNLTDAGLWHSKIEYISINGFPGTGLHFRGPNTPGVATNQFDSMYEVVVSRTSSSSSKSLVIEGDCGNLEFHSGQYDGPFGVTGSPGTDIYIGTIAGGSWSPFDILMDDVHTQWAAVAVQLNGCLSCTFTHDHYEGDFGAFLFTKGSGGTGSGPNWGVSINSAFFLGTTGVNSGSGYLVNNTDTQTDATFENNEIYGIPDHIIIGTNLASMNVRDNFFASQPATPLYSGTTMQLTPSATLGTFGAHTVYLNASATAITTINSTLGPGEYITFICGANQCLFSTGGNIDLTGIIAPLTLNANETATFVRNDINGTWRFVASTASLLNGKSNSAGPIVGTVASGTASMTTALIAAGACGTTVTITSGTVANVLGTDVLHVTRNAAVTNANGGVLTLNSWVLAGSVNFNYCNPTAAGVTPTATTINWVVTR
jgi:hypothetical protein